MDTFSYDAVIFDLDGVVTDTASVHASAWKQLFDEFLFNRANKQENRFVPFDGISDYNKHVNGRSRIDGVREFLASRGIAIKDGDTDDGAGTESVYGLACGKDKFFLSELSKQGIAVFDSTVSLARKLKSQNIACGIASSSKNCKLILESAGLVDLFQEVVDGEDLVAIGLKGKPKPDIFFECADRLNIMPYRGVVIEDAISGVQAARDGGFKLVIGLDRVGQAESLRQNGADIVLSDLVGVGPFSIEQWCQAK